MGTDKALLAVDGIPMARRVATALAAAAAAPILAIGGDLPALAALGLDARPDPRQGEGPLGGLVSAFEALPAADVVAGRGRGPPRAAPAPPAGARRRPPPPPGPPPAPAG